MKLTIDRVQFDNRRALVREWKARARAVRKQFLYRATMMVFDDLTKSIPSDHRDLKKSLGIARVTGLPDTVSAYLIRSVPRGFIIQEASASTTVLYVTPKTNLMQPIPKIVKILEEYSPWTTETLPVQPDPKIADITSRRVSERVVEKVRRLRERDRPAWRRKLNEAGVRDTRKEQVVRATRRMRATPDMAFESFRLEFGLGVGARPHWRPAILKLASRGGAGMIARKREFTRAMTDLGYMGWKIWPNPITTQATVPELKKYVPFQKKLGILVR